MDNNTRSPFYIENLNMSKTFQSYSKHEIVVKAKEQIPHLKLSSKINIQTKYMIGLGATVDWKLVKIIIKSNMTRFFQMTM